MAVDLSNLRTRDLRGAKLAGADLCGANLADADLRGAHLAGANLRGAWYAASTRLPEGFDPEAALMVRVDE